MADQAQRDTRIRELILAISSMPHGQIDDATKVRFLALYPQIHVLEQELDRLELNRNVLRATEDCVEKERDLAQNTIDSMTTWTKMNQEMFRIQDDLLHNWQALDSATNKVSTWLKEMQCEKMQAVTHEETFPANFRIDMVEADEDEDEDEEAEDDEEADEEEPEEDDVLLLDDSGNPVVEDSDEDEHGGASARPSRRVKRTRN